MWALNAKAEVRPHYGGTLNVALRESCSDLSVLPTCANFSRLVFETLVQLDERGRPQPLLAASWQAEPGNQRWRFLLRGGVSFHDGTALDANAVVASLRAANPDWRVFSVGETVVIETSAPDTELVAELALPQDAIMRRNADRMLGTGPFAIREWVAGKHLSLNANDQYWAGRPFLDAIEVDFARNEREQMLALELGKVDVADVAPEAIARARADGRNVAASQPAELMALVFTGDARTEDEVHFRNSLTLALDSSAISNVVLQGGAEPTAALLPNWLSGYAFTFTSGPNLERARQERAQSKRTTMSLGYDSSDPIARLIAERIQLNARDAGISVQLAASSAVDVKLVRISLPSRNPQLTLAELAKAVQLPAPHFNSDSVSDLRVAEKDLLQSHRIIPLLHLQQAAAFRNAVHGFEILPDGEWRVSDVWLSTERP